MNHIEMTVDGMTCGGCTSRLKRVLESAAGVTAAQVVLETKHVQVDYEPSAIDAAAIKALVADAGFTVVPA